MLLIVNRFWVVVPNQSILIRNQNYLNALGILQIATMSVLLKQRYQKMGVIRYLSDCILGRSIGLLKWGILQVECQIKSVLNLELIL